MLVSRIGWTPVKGGRHLEHDWVRLDEHGPVGDRVFALVDPVTRTSVLTAPNRRLALTTPLWDGRTLAVRFPDDTLVSGEPTGTGETVYFDYFGRGVPGEVQDGPWAQAYSDYLGQPVVLARMTDRRGVVYGAPVSLITTSSLRWLSQVTGQPIPDGRFRMTLTLDTGAAPAFVEEGWLGRRVGLGGAVIRINGLVARCPVIEVNPVTGEVDTALQQALARERPQLPDRPFGVDAVVVRPGIVRLGDPVTEP